MTKRAIVLAERGKGRVSPGPLVGCVILDAEGAVVGEGTYLYEKIIHAEVAALEEAGPKAKGGTAYISLEPHSHHGKTAPCTEALIGAGISRVVAPIEDPNPLVAGKGFEALRNAGVEVKSGLLKEEATVLNEKFIHWHLTGRPFVHLKMAASLDGRIATRTRDSKWITGEASRSRVQELRHEYDAILVGRGTIDSDDPSLTDRSGLSRRRPLTRVVLDTLLSTAPAAKVIESANENPTIFVCSSNCQESRKLAFKERGVHLIEIDGGAPEPCEVLKRLNDNEIQSVLVEGGSEISGSFFDSGCVDKVTYFFAPKIIGGRDAIASVGGRGAGGLSEAVQLKHVKLANHGDDIEVTGYPIGKTQRSLR